MSEHADDTDKSDASTHKPDDFTRATRKTPKRFLGSVVEKPQVTAVDSKTSEELTGMHAQLPAEPKDSTDSAPGDQKVASTKPKVTRQRIVEVGKLTKSLVSRMKPAGNVGSVNKKTGTADDKTERKPPGRPVSGSKMEEKFAKKKMLVDEKKAAAAGHADVKRTMNLLVEKVDSNKEDKSSTQKRVSVYCCVFCDRS